MCLIDFSYYLHRPDSLLNNRLKQYDLTSETTVNRHPISRLSDIGILIPNNGNITAWADTATPYPIAMLAADSSRLARRDWVKIGSPGVVRIL